MFRFPFATTTAFALVTCTLAACGGATPTATTLPLAPPNSFRVDTDGVLDQADLRLEEDESAYDDYVVEMRPGWTMHVTMTSDTFDTFLLVRAADGTGLAQNDDDESLGGTMLNSQLWFTPTTPGEYHVLANALSEGDFGPYHLLIEAGPDVVAPPGYEGGYVDGAENYEADGEGYVDESGDDQGD